MPNVRPLVWPKTLVSRAVSENPIEADQADQGQYLKKYIYFTGLYWANRIKFCSDPKVGYFKADPKISDP